MKIHVAARIRINMHIEATATRTQVSIIHAFVKSAFSKLGRKTDDLHSSSNSYSCKVNNLFQCKRRRCPSAGIDTEESTVFHKSSFPASLSALEFGKEGFENFIEVIYLQYFRKCKLARDLFACGLYK